MKSKYNWIINIFSFTFWYMRDCCFIIVLLKWLKLKLNQGLKGVSPTVSFPCIKPWPYTSRWVVNSVRHVALSFYIFPSCPWWRGGCFTLFCAELLCMLLCMLPWENSVLLEMRSVGWGVCCCLAVLAIPLCSTLYQALLDIPHEEGLMCYYQIYLFEDGISI